MARSLSINHRRNPTKRRQTYTIEERPVLQLPIEPPAWRAPRREGDSVGSAGDAKPDRGVAVVDFYI